MPRRTSAGLVGASLEGGSLPRGRSQGGLPEQARAGLNIALLMADQMSVNRGSWVLATELSLQAPPPMSNFRRREQVAHPTDPVYSRILDLCWAEIALARVRDEADFLDKRTKLSQRTQQPLTPPSNNTPNQPTIKPKARQRRPKAENTA